MFVKVYLLDPSLIGTCADILLNGGVMNRHFQALETHIPYLLKFCIDHNLYGMNYLQTAHFRVRSDPNSTMNKSLPLFRSNMQSPSSGVPPNKEFLSSDQAPRLTCMELEVDISAPDVINQKITRITKQSVKNPRRPGTAVFTDGSVENPGLEALWVEERFRRMSHVLESNAPEIPSPEELLPLTKSRTVIESDKAGALWNRWTQLCEQLTPKTRTESSPEVPSTTDDFVSQWLRQSQEDDWSNLDMDVQPEPTADTFSILANDQIVSPRSERESVASGEAVSLTSTQVLLNAASQYELQRIASATEEVDALVPTGDCREGLPWGFLKSTSEWRSVESHKSLTTGPHGQDVLHSTAVGPELLGSSDANQGTGLMGLSPSRLSSASTVLVNPRSCSSFGDVRPVDDEATLLSQATRSAIQYVCSGGRDVHGSLEDFEHVVEAFDDISMLDVVDTGIEDWEDVEDQEWFTQTDVTGDSRTAVGPELLGSSDANQGTGFDGIVTFKTLISINTVHWSNPTPASTRSAIQYVCSGGRDVHGSLEDFEHVVEAFDDISMLDVVDTGIEDWEDVEDQEWFTQTDVTGDSRLVFSTLSHSCFSSERFVEMLLELLDFVWLLPLVCVRSPFCSEPIPQVDGTEDTEPSDSDNTGHSVTPVTLLTSLGIPSCFMPGLCSDTFSFNYISWFSSAPFFRRTPVWIAIMLSVYSQCTSVDFTTCPTRSAVELPADASAADNSLLSTTSFSVLYQTASKRCFLSVQVDHTTVLVLSCIVTFA
ncbi:hypothetical protein AHF37_03750 [Paragonimus kellicotti]|nr:hypothetical protein AHF37_03750 [Paragonimus kellicotti]